MKNFEYAKKRNKKFDLSDFVMVKIAGYKCFFLILPILPFVIAYDKIKDRKDKQQTWSEEKATKVLDSFLPYALEYVEEDDAYYYCISWVWNNGKLTKYSPLTLKVFANKFTSEIKEYLEVGYENKNFIKTVEKDYCDTWIKFVKKND